MRHYLLHRLSSGLLVLWAAFTLSFVLLQVLPGDAVLIKFQNPDLGLSPQQIAEMRLAYGADSPLWRQYLHTLFAMLHGDFGFSVQAGVAVSAQLADSLPGTLRLALCGFLLATLLAFGLAALSRLPALRGVRSLLQSVPALFISIPTFWLGIALIQIFSFQLRWIGNQSFTVAGLAVTDRDGSGADLRAAGADPAAQHRRGLYPALVAVARAKGASESRVLWCHVLRNAMLPVLTIAGLLLGELIAGALITETVFGLGGLGQLTQQAVNNQDVAVLQAVVMISALGFVAINLLVDLLMPLFDPRLQPVSGGAL